MQEVFCVGAKVRLQEARKRCRKSIALGAKSDCRERGKSEGMCKLSLIFPQPSKCVAWTWQVWHSQKACMTRRVAHRNDMWPNGGIRPKCFWPCRK